MLMNHGVTETAAPQWEAVWRAAWVAEWPDYAQMEAHQFPAESLTGYLSNCKDTGHHPSPGRWLQWFNDDRNRRIGIIDSQRVQGARLAEDPNEREARQNRHLPPDRSGDIPTTQAGVQQ